MAFLILLLLSVASSERACTLELHPTTRVDANDVGKVNASDPADCCSKCSENVRCKAFVFVDEQPSPFCWLKSSLNGHQHGSKGCTAGGILPPPPAPTPPTPPKPTPAPVTPGCKKDTDCNMAGLCTGASTSTQGTCKCDVGWKGEHCELINFGKAYKCGSGGLCLNHTKASGDYNFSTTFTASWGGEAVRGDNDTDWHIYAASFDNDRGLGSWLSNSRVVHGVASSPTGPYRLSDVALGPLPNTSAWDALTQVLSTRSYCARIVLILCSYCAHTVLILYSYSTHTLLSTILQCSGILYPVPT
jgi:hypothetical protein